MMVPSGSVTMQFPLDGLAKSWSKDFSKLETLIRNRVLKKSEITEVEMTAGRAICANIEEDISYGRVGIADLELLIDAAKKTPTPITEAYFIFNATSICRRFTVRASSCMSSF